MGSLKDLIKALLDLNPYKIKVHLANGEKLSFDSKSSFKEWLKNSKLVRIVEIAFYYADNVKVSIKLPCKDKDDE